jgi:hypothetical protein
MGNFDAKQRRIAAEFYLNARVGKLPFLGLIRAIDWKVGSEGHVRGSRGRPNGAAGTDEEQELP